MPALSPKDASRPRHDVQHRGASAICTLSSPSERRYQALSPENLSVKTRLSR